MTAALRTAVPTVGEAARVVDARPVGVAAGRRRVIRYLIEGIDGDGPTPVVGKAHTTRHRAALAEENLRLLGAVFAGTPGLRVPRAVCRLPDLQVVLYREVAGTALDAVDGPRAVGVAQAAGRWLAMLHAGEAVLTRRADPGHEVADAAVWAARVAEAAPHAGRAAVALAGRLADAVTALPAVREVPVHRDLHAGHVLAPAGDRAEVAEVAEVVVIDLDEARMGDPAGDVAHVCTYLDASGGPTAAACRAAFLAGYGPIPGPEPEMRLAVYAAHTALKIAKQLVSGSGPLRPRAGLLDAVLDRGWACLPE
jgi:aminoglycoside phosphotransferase (APT) family kinase protein